VEFRLEAETVRVSESDQYVVYCRVFKVRKVNKVTVVPLALTAWLAHQECLDHRYVNRRFYSPVGVAS